MPDSTLTPIVSVIIPTHNRASLLPRAVLSVLGQTMTSLECIVIDDASSDDTPAVVQGFASDERFRYIRHESNKGGSAARNTGIKASRGQYIALLDDDDEWLPSKLEKQMHLFTKCPAAVGLVYCWMDYYDSRGQLMKEHHPTCRGYVFPLLLGSNEIGGCPTLVLRKEVVEAVGGFDESLTIEDDWDFVLRVCKRVEVDVVPEVLVRVDYGHGLPQVSRVSLESKRDCLQAIACAEAKLRLVLDEPRKYRHHISHYYAQEIYLYGRLGLWGRALSALISALRAYPLNFNAIGLTIRTVLRGITKRGIAT